MSDQTTRRPVWRPDHGRRQPFAATCAVVAALAACGTATTPPGPVAHDRAVVPMRAAATPTTGTDRFGARAPLPNGLRVPARARLVAPIGRTSEGRTAGWYAVVEPESPDDVQDVRAELVAQAVAQGYQPTGTSSSETVRVTGRMADGGLRQVDIAASPASSGFPAYVRIIVTDVAGAGP